MTGCLHQYIFSLAAIAMKVMSIRPPYEEPYLKIYTNSSTTTDTTDTTDTITTTDSTTLLQL